MIILYLHMYVYFSHFICFRYCRQQGDACTDQNSRYLWFFLRANFLPDFRSEALNLLGIRLTTTTMLLF